MKIRGCQVFKLSTETITTTNLNGPHFLCLVLTSKFAIRQGVETQLLYTLQLSKIEPIRAFNLFAT